MKTLSLLGQEISPNRVKTWITYVGLDLVVPPFLEYSEGDTAHQIASDLWNYKLAGVSSYATDPSYRLAPSRSSYPDAEDDEREFQQFSMLPYLQTATFPSLIMSHIPAEATADGIRAEVTVVFVNPVSSFSTSTLYDTLSTADTVNSANAYFATSKVLEVGASLGLFTRFYLPETLTREAWKGIPWVPFESPIFEKPQADDAEDWDWSFPNSRDPWFIGRISSVEAVGETITVKATNQESGFVWPRIPEAGTFLPSRGERIPIVYGFANHYSTPILDAPWHGTLASNLTDTQTDGIRLSPPFDGLPASGNLWIGGEKISYTSVDRLSGLLSGVSVRRIGGVEVGSATFHNAGAAVFAEGSTRIVLGTDEMSGISSLYVRANSGEVPVRILSGSYSIETKTNAENKDIESGTTEAVITAGRFEEVVQLYQRATLSRQPILNAPGATLVDVEFGPDAPDPGDLSPWGRATMAVERGSAERIGTQAGDLVFSDGDESNPYLLAFPFDPLLLEYSDFAIFSPATSAPGSSFGDPNVGGYVRVFWPLVDPSSDWSDYDTYEDHWVGRIQFSYDLRISAIGRQQEFVVALIGGGGTYYDTANGDPVASVVVEAGEPGTYTMEWAMDVQASGYTLADIMSGPQNSGGTRFAVFPGASVDGGTPDFTWELKDASGDVIYPTGTFTFQEASVDGVETVVAPAPTSIVSEASDDGTNFFASLSADERRYTTLFMNVFGLFEGKFQYLNRQEINSSSTFGNPDSAVTGPGQWLIALDYAPDLSGVDSAAVCLSWKVEIQIEGTDEIADRYDNNFRIEDMTDSALGAGIQGDFLDTDLRISKYEDAADEDLIDKTFTSGSSVVSGANFEGVISGWDSNPFGIRVSCQNHYDTGSDGNSRDPYLQGAKDYASESDPDLRPQFTVTATWTLTTTATLDPPSGRGENVEQIPGAIVAHPGALGLEFFADGSGPLAVLDEEINPSDSKTDSWQDFAALDSENYGEGTVLTNPTDIIKRWAQKSTTLASAFRGGPERYMNPWGADYDSGTWEESEENLNEHYRIFAYDSDAPYLMGFDARNLGSDWESVLARIAFEARTNLVRSSGPSPSNIMPFRFLSAGRAPSFPFPAVSKQIDVNEILEFNYLGKRAADFANVVSVNYDSDDSRIGNADDALRYRSLTSSHPYGLVGTTRAGVGTGGFYESTVAGFIGGTWDSYRFTQTAAESAIWVDFPTNVSGSQFQSITVGIDRSSTVGQNSTFIGSLTYRTPSDEWDADGDAGNPTINYTDYGLGDPTNGEGSGRVEFFTYDLLSPPDDPPVAAWDTFEAAWTAEYESIQGVRIGLDSTLGSVPSRWIIYSITLSDSRNEQLITSLEQIGPRPISYSLETHRGTEGAEDWRRYMENALSDSALMVEVVVETSVGWDVELGDVVTVDVPAQIIDEEVTPVAATVDIRVIGWERNSDGVALRGVIL